MSVPPENSDVVRPEEYEYVEEPDHLDEALDALRPARVLAVDTEANSMHAYFERVCLVQVASDRGDAYIFDPIALDGFDGFAESMADPDVVTVFHGADFDVSSLSRDFGFGFGGVFDTMVASQLLGDERFSLRDLVERWFEVELAKAHTKTDWGRRPLSDDQLEYSFLDVKYLVELYEIQAARLAEADLRDEAQMEFDRLAARTGAEREFDPHRWARIKRAKELGPGQQSVLAEIFVVRDRHARNLDRPPYKVIGNDTLFRLAESAPRSMRALREIRGVSAPALRHMGKELIDAIERGVDRGEPPARPRRKGDPARRLDYQAQKRLGRLREWRNAASEKSGVTTVAILPNYAMFEVARLWPRTVEELSEIEGVGPTRTAKWGKDILKQLG